MIAMMKRITYFALLIVLLELIVNLNVFVSSLSSAKQYGYKFRFTRYGDVDNCGKRKRNVDNRKCFRQCQSDADCKGSKRRCLCDGECGLSCVRITTSCSKVGEFKNGQVSYHPDNYFGGQLIYECNAGYALLGERVRVCEGDGWWSGSSPICQKEIFCENIPSITNAIPNIQINNQTKYKTGTEIEYQCDIGYTSNSDSIPINNNKVVCQEDAKWSESKFQCTRINCGRPENIENGHINGNDYFYSSVIEYKCLPGYRIRNGDFLRECDLDGQWSGRKPTCEPVDCGEPPNIRNGQANYNSTLLNSKAVYRCVNEEKFALIGANNELVCMTNGKWSSYKLPECIQKNCTLNSTEYSKKNYNIFSSIESIENYVYPINTVIRVLCQPGYEIVGNTQLTCLSASNSAADWSHKPPTCRQEVYCPIVSPPEFGLISANKQSTSHGYPSNTTLEFTCIQGYRLEGSRWHLCTGEGKWSGDRVSCTQVTTTPTTTTSTTMVVISSTRSPLFMSSSSSSSNPRSRYESCKIDTSSIIISYANSINTNFVQSVNDFVFENASIGTFIEHGAMVGYHCKAHSVITYMAKCINGTLLMEQNCNELSKASKSPCSTPPKIPHGYNKYSSSLHGSKAFYQCFNGYELSKGDGELRCVDGEWMGAIPICVKVTCAYPGPLENGKIYYIGTLAEYTYQPYMSSVGQNKQIRYECDRNYKLVGPNGSTCINGGWKPNVRLVKCIRDDEITSETSSLKPALESVKTVLFKQKSGPKSGSAETSPNQDDNKKANKLKRLKKHKSKRLNQGNVSSSADLFRKRRRLRNKSSDVDTPVFRQRVYHEKKTYLNY